MRATITDIAREAAVSTATVDRVLHGRAGVRGRTRARVLAAARATGYLEAPDGIPAVTLDFILPGGTNTFMALLADRIEAVVAGHGPERVLARLHHVGGLGPELVAACLRELAPDCGGVAVVALDHPVVREALREVAVRGLPVVTMVSDVAAVPRQGYVGIDNRAAGRLAGFLLGRLMPSGPGEVALLAGSLSYRGHEEREVGFRGVLAEDFPRLRVVELREGLDDLARSYREASALLAARPGLGGIYNIGAGNRGIAQALEEAGRARQVVFVGHELTKHTRRYLLSRTMDAVLDQAPALEAQAAVDCLLRAARGEPAMAPAPLRIQAIFRENLPEA